MILTPYHLKITLVAHTLDTPKIQRKSAKVADTHEFDTKQGIVIDYCLFRLWAVLAFNIVN
jgi:hypothetical protein